MQLTAECGRFLLVANADGSVQRLMYHEPGFGYRAPKWFEERAAEELGVIARLRAEIESQVG